MKKAVAHPPVSSTTLDALNYLLTLPNQVIRDRYLNSKKLEQGNSGVILKAMCQSARLTNDWRCALLMEAEELQKIYAISEQALYCPYAEASLAYRGMAATLYQKFDIKKIDSRFDRFRDIFSSFDEFWCAVEWDLMYQAMRATGLINVAGEEIKLQGKRKCSDDASQFFKYLDSPPKSLFDKTSKLYTPAEALFFCAIYYAQQDSQFRCQEFAVFKAILKRCHREVRNNKLQLGYLLEDQRLVIFEKHNKKVLEPIREE